MLEVRYNKPYIDSHLINPIISLGLYELGTILNEPTYFANAILWLSFKENFSNLVTLSGMRFVWL